MFRGAKPRVVILGTGWGGNKLARRLNKDMFDVRMISPANHFLMTPLLPSTAVGTLEFRAIQEPVRTIPGLQEYYQAKARELDVEGQTVLCEDVFKGNKFEVPYDYLCIAAGNKTNTFNTPGVADREGQDVFFLKHLFHARQIRNRILECFERASNPTITQEERDRLLSFIVVGGDVTAHCHGQYYCNTTVCDPTPHIVLIITDWTATILILLCPEQVVRPHANSPLSCMISS